MRRKNTPRFDKLIVFGLAIKFAYLKQVSFTSASLAEAAKCSDTRHFRAYMMDLVHAGYLMRHRVLFSDGHYRCVFCGQLTRELPFVYVATALEAQHEA